MYNLKQNWSESKNLVKLPVENCMKIPSELLELLHAYRDGYSSFIMLSALM